MALHNGQAVLIAGGFSSATLDDHEPAGTDRFDLRNFEMLPARDVPVTALSPGPLLRQGGTNSAHVQLLIDAANSSQLPPILVQEDGWRLIDGAHRLEAAKLRGDHTIRARFLDCTDSEALVLAMKANTSHGLPLAKTERVSGAKQVLAAHPDWSDRAIAGITGLSAKTIASLRGRSPGTLDPGTKRIGRDGRQRPVAAGDGRRRAAEYISANPNATLRQVARETDVSLGTVHDVSARLRRGVSPERGGHHGPARLAIHPVERTTAPSVAPAISPAIRTIAPAPAPAPTPLRRKNHVDPPLTWEGVAAKVANDPAIRYTDGGREFLRWMAMHASDPDRWRDFAATIPAHWHGVIAPIAESIAREWSQFADRLNTRQESAR
ncbi:MAG TPA: ParB N-terminal domain-containing protein [Streptosporangiaceae bacterium]|nr:ParB N-terminal domain-containing protein [Streptosporangiaceae bacterium]